MRPFDSITRSQDWDELLDEVLDRVMEEGEDIPEGYSLRNAWSLGMTPQQVANDILTAAR